MAKSMTAFASVELSSELGTLRMEMKSVNHRFLEFTAKLPEELRSSETTVRERVQKSVQRGKVDLYARFKAAPSTQSLALDETLVTQLISLADKLHHQHPELKPMATANVLAWPGVLQSHELDREALRQQLLQSLERLVIEFELARAREGQQLKALLLERVQLLRGLRTQAIAVMPEVQQAIKDKFELKLAELRSTLDPARLEGEIVLALQKMDVDEELDRLRVHLDEIERVLGTNEAVGRRLDFLVQELHRECNTFGSKSAHIRSSQLSVDMKVLVEQMREQLQNLE